MAITFNFNAQQTARVVQATCANRGYQATIQDESGNTIPNPETQGQFTKRWWLEQIKAEVRTYEANEAERTARSNFQPPTES